MKKILKKNLKLDKEVIASLSENEMVKVTGGDGSLIVTDKPNCTETMNDDCKFPMYTEFPCRSRFTELDCTPIGNTTEIVTNGRPCDAVYTNHCSPTLADNCAKLTISCETSCCIPDTVGCV